MKFDVLMTTTHMTAPPTCFILLCIIGLTESPSAASIASIDESTPSAAPAPAPIPDAVSHGTSKEDLDKIRGLEADVKDLNEKLETIKAKRQEDRNKLKEFEKIKIQYEQVRLTA